jgi:integrator complex subunit 9
MLIMLDCGLGQEQLYSMPVREGGLANDHNKDNNSNTAAGSITDNTPTGSKRKLVETDIRQDWASFLKASSMQFPSKKHARGSNNSNPPAYKTTPAFTEPTSSKGSTEGTITTSTKGGSALSQSTSTREYMFKLPDFSGVDLKAIDVVVVSNYNHLLALPYLTEYTDFQGRIFATEPTIEFGRFVILQVWDRMCSFALWCQWGLNHN